MAVNDGGGIPALASHASGVPDLREASGREGESPAVLLPGHARDTGRRFLRGVEVPVLAGPDLPLASVVGCQPCRQGVAPRNHAAPSHFGGVPANDNVPPGQVHVSPLDPFDFGTAKAGESRSREARQEVRRGRGFVGVGVEAALAAGSGVA
jgi:hypothetical protein